MTTPLDQIAQAIQTAIDGAISDSEGTLKNIAAAAAGGGGGSSSDSASTAGFVLGLVGTIAAISDPEVLAAFEGLKELEGQGGSNAQDFIMGFFIGNVLVPAAEPYMRYITHFMESQAESQIFDPATAAELAAKGIITDQFGASEASGGGYDNPHWEQLFDNARVRPDIGSAQDAWNRNLITESDFNVVLQYAGIPQYWWPMYKQLRHTILSPADIALASLRGNITDGDATSFASMAGMEQDELNILIGNTGEPPGLMQLLEAYRRGFIDQATLAHGIRQSRVRDEWIDTVERLRYAPMSTADAVRAVVQNYLSDDDGKKIAEQNGLEPEHWETLREAFGRPLSHEQMMQLYYRGKVTIEQVHQAFRESDLKDKYINQATELGVKLPALFETVNLYKNGSLSAPLASRILLEQGYQKDIVDYIVKSAGTEKPATPKHMTTAELEQMYQDGLLSEDQVKARMVKLGYSKDDADALVTLVDAKLASHVASTEITKVGKKFQQETIDATQAEKDLTHMGVSSANAKRIINLWKLEQEATVKQLTPSQVLRMLKAGLLDRDQAHKRLVKDGYSTGDATLLIDLEVGKRGK